MRSKVKIIIISVLIVLVVAGGTFGVLWMVMPHPKTDSEQDTTAQNIPDYKSCDVLTSDMIQSAFNKTFTSLSKGTRSAVVAPNNTPAEQCNYDFATKKSSDNTLTVETYVYSVSTEKQPAPDQTTAAWSAVSGAKVPTYFYNGSNGDRTIYEVRIAPGAKNVMIAISMPKGNEAYTFSEAYIYLTMLASKANVGVTTNAGQQTPSNLPPAPHYDDKK